MAATQATYDPVIKELWPQRRINNMAFEGSAVFALMRKEEDFYEKIKHIAFQYANNQGRSATFADAQAIAGNAQLEDFLVTKISDYAVGIVNGETLETTKHKDAALVSAIDNETKGALEELSNTLAFDLWRAGSGARGNVAVGGIATVNLTLANVEDAKNFEVGMQVVAAATETGALRNSGASAIITGINYSTGVLTSSSNWTAQIAALVDGDFLFPRGDAQAGGSALRKVSGIPAWIPSGTVSATPFFGAVRTVHEARMAGHRQDGTGMGTFTEATKRLAARIATRGGRRAKPDTVFFNFEDLDRLDSELGDNRRYERVDVDEADVGFEAIVFSTPVGRMRAIGDQHVPRGFAWMLQMNTWVFGSVDGVPRIIQHDGNRMLRQGAADGVEFRAVYRGQPWCDAPGWNGVTSLPA